MLLMPAVMLNADANTALSELAREINKHGEYIKLSKNSKTGETTKSSYLNRIEVSDGEIGFYFEKKSQRKGNSFFGYRSSHWARDYRFEVCEIYQYFVSSDFTFANRIDTPSTGQVRLWVNSGYVERIDLDKSGGDESTPRAKSSFDLEMILPNDGNRPVEVMKLILGAMREGGCASSPERAMGSETVVLQ